MDAELSKQILTSARERHDRAVKWSSLAILLAALFHVLVFVRYVDLRKSAAAARSGLDPLNGRRESLAELSGELSELEQAITDWRDRGLDGYLEDIKDDFVSLNAVLDDLRQGRDGAPYLEAMPGDGEGDMDAALEAPPRESIAQMPLEAQMNGAAMEPERIWILPPALVQALKKSEPVDLQVLLRPVVDQQILGPRFRAMNQQWRVVAAGLTSMASEIERRLEGLVRSDPEHSSTWARMLDGVHAASQSVDGINFAPPQGTTWWYTAGGKTEEFIGLRDEIDASTRGALAGTSDVEAIRAAVEGAIEAKEADLAALQEKQERLEQSFKEQSAVLASLGEPFKFLAADLEYLITRFPLLLGALLASTAVLVARSLVGLIVAARAASGSDEPSRALEALTLGTPASRGAVAGRALVGVVWVALAALALRGWPGEEARELPWYAAIGVTAVLIAEGYRAVSLRRAFAGVPRSTP